MAIDKQLLNETLALIQEDSTGPFLSGEWLAMDSHLLAISPDDKRQREVGELLRYAHSDLQNLTGIVWRLLWEKRLQASEELDDSRWRIFAGLDIDLFHVEFRSLFDYLGRLVSVASDSPGVRDKSFEKLRRWLQVEMHRVQFGNDLAESVLACTWFGELRRIRDTALHSGGFSLVFPHADKILFQCYSTHHAQVSYPEVMWNRNVADFELYAGLHLGYTFAWLDRLSTLLFDRLCLRRVGSDARWYHPVFGSLRDWIESLLSVSASVEDSF